MLVSSAKMTGGCGGVGTSEKPKKRTRSKRSRKRTSGANLDDSSSSSEEEEEQKKELPIAIVREDRADHRAVGKAGSNSEEEEEGEEEGKRKRKRKRTRGREKKGEVGEGPSEQIQAESLLMETGERHVDEEEEKVRVVSGPIEAPKVDDLNGADGQEKRRRKRTRGKGKKGEAAGGDGEEGPAEEQSTVEPTPSASIQTYLNQVGLPEDRNDLSEKTTAALSYARQYHMNRKEWKFNKAKQEFLIRHMLTPPLTSEAEASHDVEGKEKGEKGGDGGEKEEEETGDGPKRRDQHWSDDWNEMVAKYLVTIQGKAKERLLEMLRKAADQVVPPMAEEVEAPTASPSAPVVLPPSATKTVSFADMAMQHDKAENQGDKPAALSANEVLRIQFEKDRAQKMLQNMRD